MSAIYRMDAGFDGALFEGSSCAFGVFDGLHRGHRYLLAAAQGTACDTGGTSIALTFDRDPDEVFRPGELKKLLSNEDRIELLASSGVDAVCVLPFTRELASEEPLEFLESTFGAGNPAHLHVGVDFRFGARARGHIEDLRSWAGGVGACVHAHHLVSADGSPVSATRIRSLLAQARIEEANELLGRPYVLHGVVRHGREDGRAFGFRTANLEIPVQLQVAAEGVYGGYARIGEERFRAAIAVGKSPMFEEETTATCEVNILDFDRDIYDENLWVELHHHLRPLEKFGSVEDLVAAVQADRVWVSENL